jgi:hypothetical protein
LTACVLGVLACSSDLLGGSVVCTVLSRESSNTVPLSTGGVGCDSIHLAHNRHCTSSLPRHQHHCTLTHPTLHPLCTAPLISALHRTRHSPIRCILCMDPPPRSLSLQVDAPKEDLDRCTEESLVVPAGAATNAHEYYHWKSPGLVAANPVCVPTSSLTLHP